MDETVIDKIKKQITRNCRITERQQDVVKYLEGKMLSYAAHEKLIMLKTRISYRKDENNFLYEILECLKEDD